MNIDFNDQEGYGIIEDNLIQEISWAPTPLEPKP